MNGTCVVIALYDGPAQYGVRVTNADPLIHISDSLLDEPPPFVESGEGLFVINSVDGPIRYRLLAHHHGGYWSAQRIDKTRLAS